MFGFGNKFTPENDIPSLEGRVILVTGGNTGLGKETVLQLAKHNPSEIFLAARTASKGEAAIEEIKKALPDANVTFLQLDLASLKSVKKAADDFKSRSDRLDILINNAGVMALPYSKTVDGYEIQFGTNHVGHALLTKLLLPTLLKTAEKPSSDVRIVNVSSAGHMFAPAIVYDQDKLEGYTSLRRYGQSKLSNIFHARQLAKHYPTITAVAIHPGVIITDLYNPINKYVPLSKSFLSVVFFTSVEAGAKNQLWAATAPKEQVRESYYWTPVGVKSGGSFWYAQNEALSEELWEWDKKELKKWET